MYTQCPDCGTAFKVTAEVLKQAAGKVRCGGCSNAFNALLYLSEESPQRPSTLQPEESSLPELTPEVESNDTGLPKTISAEQSAALLKTLDELAGSDIRIEDTGVEWRVLDEPNGAQNESVNVVDTRIDEHLFEDTDSDAFAVDEVLEESPTPVDEFLTRTPEVVESAEVFSADANDFGRTSVDELRFDDNTPLPDDFDLDDESSYVALDNDAADATHETIDISTEEADDVDFDTGADITLTEPEEWNDLLGEFNELVADVAAPAEGEMPEQVVDALDEIDASADQPLDMDSQFALQAEAMGIDLSGIHEVEQEVEQEDESLQLEELDEADMDDDDPAAFSLDDDEGADDAEPEFEADYASDQELALENSQLDLIEPVEEPESPQHSIEDELGALDVDADDDFDDLDELVADDPDSADEELLADESRTDEEHEHYVPPLTKEEQTVNMMIDQDLMALAIEDEDGFASTIIIPEKDTESLAFDDPAAGSGLLPDDDDHESEALGFETIIMEGEHIRSAMDPEKLAADKAAAAEMARIARENEAQQNESNNRSRYGIAVGIFLLLVLLLVQVLHQSREALATVPAFNAAASPVYRALGSPLQPAWDVKGWRFEATKGQAEGEPGNEQLKIYSRLGNNSDNALPYPLIGISLTDRFEENIGGRVLDPTDYLATSLDPRTLVEPGQSFDALITIESPDAIATGFNLHVCYRSLEGQLRCAMEDFK